MTMKRLTSLGIFLLISHRSLLAQDTGRGRDTKEQQFASSDSVAPSSIVNAGAINPKGAGDYLNLSALEAQPSGHPQSLVFRTDLDSDLPSAVDSTSVDSLPRPVKRKLLPDNMSFMERGMWGENGILRGIGIASPLTPEVRKHELAVRRTMLTMHQIGGFLTLGSMIAADYFGQMSLNNRNTGQKDDPYRSRHQTFVASTITLYAATGLLSILSPPPLIRRDETSTTTIHKTLAWIHVAGMILTPIIGNTILKRGPVGRYADLNQARFHQISAYATTAVFAASMIVVTF